MKTLRNPRQGRGPSPCRGRKRISKGRHLGKRHRSVTPIIHRVSLQCTRQGSFLLAFDKPHARMSSLCTSEAARLEPRLQKHVGFWLWRQVELTKERERRAGWGGKEASKEGKMDQNKK